MKYKTILQLKEKIEVTRDELNNVIIEEIDKIKIVKLSQELDILITEYMIKLIDQKSR